MSNSEYPSCTICKTKFTEENLNKDCWHMSGIHKGVLNGHLHVCTSCANKHGLVFTTDFDEIIKN